MSAETVMKRMLAIRTVYTKHAGYPPDWTRYLSIDPSHTRTAVASLVVPPTSVLGVTVGDIIVLERDLVMKKASAIDLAKAILMAFPVTQWEAFIMDRRIGQQTRVGMPMNVFQIYQQAFEEHNLRSRLTHSGFIPGCDIPTRRQTNVRKYLQGDNDGPRLFFTENACPNTLREIVRYEKKQVTINGSPEILDEPANPRKFDCMAALEYGVDYIDTQFQAGTARSPHSPRAQVDGPPSAALRKRFKTLKSMEEGTTDNYYHLGPTTKATTLSRR